MQVINSNDRPLFHFVVYHNNVVLPSTCFVSSRLLCPRTAGDFITPALLQSCSVNLFPFSGYSFGLDVVTEECSRVIVGSIGVLSFAEALTHLIGFRASCMIGRMRTVICLLRNDLRVHDNEVLMTSYWQILLPFLSFPHSFQ